MTKFYTVAAGNATLDLPAGQLQRAYAAGRIKPDAIEVYANGRERPLFSEVTLEKFALDLKYRAAK